MLWKILFYFLIHLGSLSIGCMLVLLFIVLRNFSKIIYVFYVFRSPFLSAACWRPRVRMSQSRSCHGCPLQKHISSSIKVHGTELFWDQFILQSSYVTSFRFQICIPKPSGTDETGPCSQLYQFGSWCFAGLNCIEFHALWF